jgi:hypothetical protein
MPNFLEQLVAEWYEYQGFFVRRNVLVGTRAQGGHEGELDVVAFHPVKNRLVHVETSIDSDSWAEREERFSRKFRVGRERIRTLFEGFQTLPEIEPIALFVFGSAKGHPTIGGGRVQLIGELLSEIRAKIPKDVAKSVIPEQYMILRTLQFAGKYWE